MRENKTKQSTPQKKKNHDIEFWDRGPAGMQEHVWVKQETLNPVSCFVI